MKIQSLKSQNIAGKTLLIRQDLNVPIKNAKVNSDKRILASLPTIKYALQENAGIILMSHLGRPIEGKFEEQYSLQPVANYLSEHLKQTVNVINDWKNGVDVKPGELVLLENIRFNPGEKTNDPELSKNLASLCDIYVMDAFGTAHRKQASTYGVAQFAPKAVAGPLLENELKALDQSLSNPERPMIAIVGGSKVSTKLTVLESLSSMVDQLIVGGGIANTFIAASGYNVGKSLYEKNLIPEAQKLIKKALKEGREIPIPTDVVTAKEFSDKAEAEIKNVRDVEDDDMILDIGPETATKLAQMCQDAGTVVWNGPVGVFEFNDFSKGTEVLASGIACGKGFSIAGGGDTLAAIDMFNIADQISYISTGGGAFLEFLEGKKLPAVEILESRFER